MEQLAVISDIHGNMPALEAVLEDIRARGIGRILCLGDLVGKGPHPEKATDRILEVCEQTVTGNWDEFIGSPSESEEIMWQQRRLGPQRLERLAKLPFHLDLWMSGRHIRLFHAHPTSPHRRVQAWDALEERLGLFANTERTGTPQGGGQPDVVGYGDIHNAYIQHLQGRTLFNTGSVGNPLDLTQAAYAILEGVPGSPGTREPGPFSITIARVPYDIELAVRQAAEEQMPLLEPYARELRTGKYRGLKD